MPNQPHRYSVLDLTPEQIRGELRSKGVAIAAPGPVNAPAVMPPIILVPMKERASKKKRHKNAVTPGSNNPVAIGGVIHETSTSGKAYKFFDGLIAVWLPVSQCEYDEQQKAMVMPEWLAFAKKLI